MSQMILTVRVAIDQDKIFQKMGLEDQIALKTQGAR